MRTDFVEPMPKEISIAAFAERLRRLDGWRRWLAAFTAGALSVLAMAPFFAWPVLWLTLCGTLLVIAIFGDFAPEEATPRDFAVKHKFLSSAPESGFVKILTIQRRRAAAFFHENSTASPSR